MTPLETGLIVLVGLVFGVVFFARVSLATLWGATYLAVTTGGYLALNPVNTTPVGWSAGVGGVVVPEEAYRVGSIAAGADFKFLVLVLFGLTGLIYLAGPTGGYEPLVIGLIAVVAGLLTLGYDNLVVLYLCLELQALALYTLVGFYRFEEERTDSAIRYLLAGSLVSGFMLLGFARAYDLNVTFHVGEFTQADPVGSAWVVGVFLFKVGAAPFHFWSPVVYAPLEWGPLALVLGATKVNVWYLLSRTFHGGVDSAWWATWWAAAASVVVGSIGGYYQVTATSLLAYSGVVNSGYLLFLLAPGDTFTFRYYLVVYLVGTVLTVAVLAVFVDTRTSAFGAWTSLGGAVPLVVYYLALNLGGLPVFPGFFAKVALVEGLLSYGFFLTGVVVALSVIPAVYYVSLAGVPLFEFSDREGVTPTGVSPGVVAYLVVGAAGATTLVGSLVE